MDFDLTFQVSVCLLDFLLVLVCFLFVFCWFLVGFGWFLVGFGWFLVGFVCRFVLESKSKSSQTDLFHRTLNRMILCVELTPSRLNFQTFSWFIFPLKMTQTRKFKLFLLGKLAK